MFFKKPITCILSIMIVSLLVSSCKVSVNTFAADVREDPIPEEYASTLFAYADSVIIDLYKKDVSALRKKSHSKYSDMFDKINGKAALKLLNAEKVDLSKKEYLGYNIYKTKDNLVFASLFYSVPLKNGSDNITLRVDPDMNDCCRLVGFNIEKSFRKSFLGNN